MSDENTFYTVGEVAERFSLTVRTLHHWETRGLLAPAERSWSNYRLYSAEDCARVQRIIIYRATGMRLTDIKALLDSGESGISHLKRQRERLIAHRQETDMMIEALDILLEDAMNDNALTVEQIGEILGDADFAAHQARAEECYGETDDWKEWHRRTASWRATGSDRAAELVDAHRDALSEYFPVSPAKHYLISRAYLCDESFRSHYDSQQEGFAQWLADAIEHVAVARGVDTDDPQWR